MCSSDLTWFGLSGPAGVPSDIVEKLNRAVIEVLRRDDVRQVLARDAIETRPMTPGEFTAFMAREIDRWAPLAKRIGQAN